MIRYGVRTKNAAPSSHPLLPPRRPQLPDLRKNTSRHFSLYNPTTVLIESVRESDQGNARRYTRSF
jgi:hypothetical protein